MAKTYKHTAVKTAVEQWKRSEWFTAGELLDLATQVNKQPRGGLNVFSVSRILMVLEARGHVSSRWKNGKKEYRREEDASHYIRSV